MGLGQPLLCSVLVLQPKACRVRVHPWFRDRFVTAEMEMTGAPLLATGPRAAQPPGADSKRTSKLEPSHPAGTHRPGTHAWARPRPPVAAASPACSAAHTTAAEAANNTARHRMGEDDAFTVSAAAPPRRRPPHARLADDALALPAYLRCAAMGSFSFQVSQAMGRDSGYPSSHTSGGSCRLKR